MIKAVIIVNNSGSPRLARFYFGASYEEQQYLLKKVFGIVSSRQEEKCSCFADDEGHFGENCKIVYRIFASLFFVFVIDDCESELGTLDLIQVFVQVLSHCFDRVCELDLIYNFDKVNHVLDEIVMGGLVLESNVETIVHSLQSVKKITDEETSFW